MFLKLTLLFAMVKYLDLKLIASCPDGWVQIDNQCYYKSRREMDFYSAERFCRVRLAAHLPILKDEKLSKLYYNLLIFHSSPYDTWLGAIPLKQLNNSWKWLDGSDILHDDMMERFLVDDDWGFGENEPNISFNATYKEAINSITEYYYLENLHCTLLILLQESETGDYTPKFDLTKCDKLYLFYCQREAQMVPHHNGMDSKIILKYEISTFLVFSVIILVIVVIFLLIFGFILTTNTENSTEATAFYSNQ